MLILTEDGADLDFNGGQPTMDGGLGTAVIMSLLTSVAWSGNAFLNPTQRLGGKFEDEINKPIQLSTLNRATAAARDDLDWLIRSGAASSVEVTVTNPVSDRIDVLVEVVPPGGGIMGFQLTRHGENWVAQYVDAEKTVR